jgi:hypothetical protein
VTSNPDVALSGLIALAFLGILVIAGGLAVNGAISGSWIQVVGGVVLLAYLSWMTWMAGQVVRKALKAKPMKPEIE